MSYNKETGMYDGYIYLITNIVNEKIYVGQTKRSLSIRFSQHKYEAMNNEQKGMYLYKAMRKYGVDNFKIEMIEMISRQNKEDFKKSLDLREIYWIDFFNSANHNIGYNLSKGGDNNGGNGIKKVDEYNLYGEFLKTWDSMIEASEFYGMNSDASISSCCRGRCQQIKNRVWRFYGEDVFKYPFKVKKKICMYSPDGTLLNTYYQEEIPDEFIFDMIILCCKGKVRKHKGFVWRYEGDSFDTYQVKWSPRSNIRQIDCYDLNGNFIKTYDNITEVMDYIKLRSTSTVYAAIKDFTKTAGGYRWKYHE